MKAEDIEIYEAKLRVANRLVAEIRNLSEGLETGKDVQCILIQFPLLESPQQKFSIQYGRRVGEQMRYVCWSELLSSSQIEIRDALLNAITGVLNKKVAELESMKIQ